MAISSKSEWISIYACAMLAAKQVGRG